MPDSSDAPGPSTNGGGRATGTADRPRRAGGGMSRTQWLILAIPLVVAVTAGVLLWIVNVQGDPTADDRIVEELIPTENAKVLQQNPVGIDLQAGWTASLQINGVDIPDEQLTKVVPQGRITFQPGKDKVIQYLQAGPNCATATYWLLSAPDQRYRRSWCFSAT